ncbi:DDE-domain-containing protein, partial [Ascobolus immersus RN42]
MLREMVVQVAQQRNRNFKKLGKRWINRFMHRHPELRSKMSCALDKQRKLAGTVSILEAFYAELIRIIIRYNIQIQHCHNCDEKGCVIGQSGKEKVIIPHGKRHAFVVQDGGREMITILETISAAARTMEELVFGPDWTDRRKRALEDAARHQTIPPFVIIKCENYMSSYLVKFFQDENGREGVLPGCGFASSPNGWTSKQIFRWWIEHHFHVYTKPSDPSQHRLLILDGHNSHITVDSLEFCRRNNIHILCLPAHTTHLLQPLDVGMFRPLQRAYGKAVDDWSRTGYASISKGDFF